MYKFRLGFTGKKQTDPPPLPSQEYVKIEEFYVTSKKSNIDVFFK
jgi:hypothetical protein